LDARLPNVIAIKGRCLPHMAVVLAQAVHPCLASSINCIVCCAHCILLCLAGTESSCLDVQDGSNAKTGNRVQVGTCNGELHKSIYLYSTGDVVKWKKSMYSSDITPITVCAYCMSSRKCWSPKYKSSCITMLCCLSVPLLGPGIHIPRFHCSWQLCLQRRLHCSWKKLLPTITGWHDTVYGYICTCQAWT